MSEAKPRTRVKNRSATTVQVQIPNRKRLARLMSQTNSTSVDAAIGLLLDHWKRTGPDERRATLIEKIPSGGDS